jgi:ABC-type microcin C transport system permease subunit YejB
MDGLTHPHRAMVAGAARRLAVRPLLRFGIGLLGVWLVTFLVIQLAPGGPVDQFLPGVYDNGEIDGPPTPGIR